MPAKPPPAARVLAPESLNNLRRLMRRIASLPADALAEPLPGVSRSILDLAP